MRIPYEVQGHSGSEHNVPVMQRWDDRGHRVYQLEMQLSIFQKHLHKHGKKPRYEVRERLLIF